MNKVEFFKKKKKKIFFLWSKQCNDMKTFFFFFRGEDILGLAISLIFDQFSIL